MSVLIRIGEDKMERELISDELALIFAELTDVDAREQMLTKNNCHTSKCVAISPVQAAKCLQEPLRTQAFLKGIKQAILDRINKSPK